MFLTPDHTDRIAFTLFVLRGNITPFLTKKYAILLHLVILFFHKATEVITRVLQSFAAVIGTYFDKILFATVL